ncbi:MAG TPA: hypothetical protein V6D11_10760 [Waterburya sp.]
MPSDLVSGSAFNGHIPQLYTPHPTTLSTISLCTWEAHQLITAADTSG